MTIIDEIDKKLNSYINRLETSNISDVDLITAFRNEEDNQSSILFNFLIERFLLLLNKQNKVIASRGILKYYLNFENKEHYDNIFFGDLKENLEDIGGGLVLNKGLFIRIIESLGLNKTKKAYISYLINQDEEIQANVHDYPYDKAIMDTSDVLDVMFSEFDEKLKDKEGKIIKIK
jgi:hypothetical protein